MEKKEREKKVCFFSESYFQLQKTVCRKAMKEKELKTRRKISYFLLVIPFLTETSAALEFCFFPFSMPIYYLFCFNDKICNRVQFKKADLSPIVNR